MFLFSNFTLYQNCSNDFSTVLPGLRIQAEWSKIIIASFGLTSSLFLSNVFLMFCITEESCCTNWRSYRNWKGGRICVWVCRLCQHFSSFMRAKSSYARVLCSLLAYAWKKWTLYPWLAKTMGPKKTCTVSVRFRLDFYCVPGTQGINKTWVPCKFYWVPESLVSKLLFFYILQC